MHEGSDLYRGGSFRLYDGANSIEEFLDSLTVGTVVAFRQPSKVLLEKVRRAFEETARALGITLRWDPVDERRQRVKKTIPNLRNSEDGTAPNITEIRSEFVQYGLIRARGSRIFQRDPEQVVIDPQSGKVLAGHIEPEVRRIAAVG